MNKQSMKLYNINLMYCTSLKSLIIKFINNKPNNNFNVLNDAKRSDYEIFE